MRGEGQFDRVFGACDWALMFILARGGETYARLRFNAGPGGDLKIQTTADYNEPFQASDHQAWTQTYNTHIHPRNHPSAPGSTPGSTGNADGNHGSLSVFGSDGCGTELDQAAPWIDPEVFDSLDPHEREQFAHLFSMAWENGVWPDDLFDPDDGIEDDIDNLLTSEPMWGLAPNAGGAA